MAARTKNRRGFWQNLFGGATLVARLIQQTLLPKALPELPGYDVAAYYQPAREVGGDFYDSFEQEDGRLGLVVGDVTRACPPRW
jgi:serine phosphatase RsbU (regulator of sigma subunit)